MWWRAGPARPVSPSISTPCLSDTSAEQTLFGRPARKQSALGERARGGAARFQSGQTQSLSWHPSTRFGADLHSRRGHEKPYEQPVLVRPRVCMQTGRTPMGRGIMRRPTHAQSAQSRVLRSRCGPFALHADPFAHSPQWGTRACLPRTTDAWWRAVLVEYPHGRSPRQGLCQ